MTSYRTILRLGVSDARGDDAVSVASCRQTKTSTKCLLNVLPNNQGVQAIFAVTNFWEHFFRVSTASESRDKEVEQGIYLP